MPRGSSTGAEEPSRAGIERHDGVLPLDDELRRALRPWIDVEEVGPEGLRRWLLSILPLVPPPSVGTRVIERDESHGRPEERVATLAQALAECATDRARTHFRASEYFRENRVLARRVRALEAMLRTRAGAHGPPLPEDPESDAATHRYLPPERSGP